MTGHRLPRPVGIGILAVALAGSVAWGVAATAGPPSATPSAAEEPAVVASQTPDPALTPNPAVAAEDNPYYKQLIGEDHTWSYYYGAGYDRKNLGTTFAKDRTPYLTGVQPLGFGSQYVTTTITPRDDSKPLTAYFKTTFRLPQDTAAWKTLDVRVHADDGWVLWIDGREYYRFRVPLTGAITDRTPAVREIATESVEDSIGGWTMPLTDLAFDGLEHVVVVEVHQNSATSPDMHMQTTLALRGDTSRTAVASGSTWSYRYDGASVPGSWAKTCNLGKEAKQGITPAGFGTGLAATNLDVRPTSARPLTAYFCTTRTLFLGPREAFGDLEITTWADDGIVVYVGGKEVGRANMPAGKITATSYATAAPWTALARRNPVTITIPNKDLPADGQLTIAAEVHLNWRGTTDMTFDLTARSTGSK